MSVKKKKKEVAKPAGEAPKQPKPNDEQLMVVDLKKELPANTPKNINVDQLIHYKIDKKLSNRDIADLLGCHETTIRYHLNKLNIASLPDYSRNKDHVLEHLQRAVVQSITQEEIKKAPFGTKLTAIGILQDKIMMIRGEMPSVVLPMVVFGSPPPRNGAVKDAKPVIDITPDTPEQPVDNSISVDNSPDNSVDNSKYLESPTKQTI